MSGKQTNLTKRNDRKISARAVVGSLAGKLLNPGQLSQAARLQLRHKVHRHSLEDAQLALYSRILPSDFLHLG
ncbi:MAG TPA: hypothetical protein VFA54_02480, partial [Bryobacterales bacterium]|nr:hypothetical protein [Bryobacterales bacterium]